MGNTIKNVHGSSASINIIIIELSFPVTTTIAITFHKFILWTLPCGLAGWLPMETGLCIIATALVEVADWIAVELQQHMHALKGK